MDATTALPVLSWILAEMVRIVDEGTSTPDHTATLVEGLIGCKYPKIEFIEDRAYVNVSGLSAPETGLVIMYAIYPKRISREKLADSIERNGHRHSAAQVAVTRMRNLIDDDGSGNWVLRGLGPERAAEILSRS